MEILKAIEEININTCVEFVPRYVNDGRHDYVEFTKDGICSSAIGRQGGKQEVALGEDCNTKGGILHELMHILGFPHEHNRHDRDQHINVNWENITPEKRPSFQKRQFEDLILKDFPYDIRSIIHFDSFAFSSNGDPTLTDLSGFPLSTQGTRMSATDIDKIKVVYGCPDFLPMPPVLPQKCVDELFLCPEQAKNCACVFAPAFMLKYCCSSCELEADEMVDRFPFCPMWKDNCGKSEVLDSFCRKTCPRCVL
uniref:Metalloendopeptidase n=1 Tax=Ciona savignyi TaxID=51511 RepID=H2ZBH6_CIOSA